MTEIERLRNFLLKPTLKHAAENSSFYKSTIGNQIDEINSIDDLVHLPFTNKAILNANLLQVITNKCPTTSFLELVGNLSFWVTSGITSAFPSFVFHNKQEELHHSRFLQKYYKGKRKDPSLTLKLIDPGHGMHKMSRSTLRETIAIIVPPSSNIFASIFQILKNSAQAKNGERRITRIVSNSPRVLLALTKYFEEQGFECGSSGVKEIKLTGEFITNKWREYLVATWGSRVIDNYSMTEFPNNCAIECNHCNYYHFFPPTIVPEVICPVTRKKIVKGIGVLVLTSLYPYMQLQPMIRYWTDDVVEISEDCSYARDLGIRYKGRLTETIYKEYANSTRYFIFSTDLDNILSQLPDVKTEPIAFENAGIIRTKGIGKPTFELNASLQKNIFQIEIGIHLRYSPRWYAERVGFLFEYIVTELQNANPHFREASTDGTLAVRIKFIGPDNTTMIRKCQVSG